MAFNLLWSSNVLVLHDSSLVELGIFLPKSSGLRKEVLFLVGVPVLCVIVNLHIILGVHAVKRCDTIFVLGSKISKCCHWRRNHLLNMMDLINRFFILEKAVWSLDEDEVFILIVLYPGDII